LIKLKAEVKTYIQSNCPQGITLHRDKNLYVKQSKMINGKAQTLTKTINIGLEQNMSVAEMKEQFETILSEALNVKRQFAIQLSNPNFTSFHKPTAVGVGTMGSVFNMMFTKEWGQCTSQQQNMVKNFYKDLEEFFGSDKRLSEFSEELIDSFKEFCAKKIAERPANMTGTVSNNSINKRLGVLRSIMRYALSKRLLSNDQLINPDLRVKNMGIPDLPRGQTKRKPAFTDREQEQLLQMMIKCGDQDAYDLWAWAFDTGMRHDGELDNFTIDNVDFSRKTITFWRPKTKCWSVEMVLTPRMTEILVRRRKEAQLRNDRKVFPSTSGSRRSNWDKYIRMCNFNKNFTPYTTRHTYITRLAEEDVNMKVVMELAGHTCIETTMTYYTKSSSKLLHNAMLKISNGYVDTKNDSIVKENEDSMIGHNSKKALK